MRNSHWNLGYERGIGSKDAVSYGIISLYLPSSILENQSYKFISVVELSSMGSSKHSIIKGGLVLTEATRSTPFWIKTHPLD
jgi:hypothetical protein